MIIDRRKSTNTIAEKVIGYGANSLSDAELLGLFLQGSDKRTATDIACDVLGVSGGLIGLVEDRQAQLSTINGLTPKRLAILFAAREFARRVVFTQCKDANVLTSPADVRQYLSLHLSGLGHEVFSALFLDNRHRIIEYRELFKGTIDSAAVYPREVVKQCLACNSVAVIFAHNHPTGIAEPSHLDVRLTRKLVDALALVDVRVLDHIVIGQGVQTSLAERGLM